ncbi:CaiB/BaiF CoA-transferase family protein [Croceicoccus sp. Ery15]|uniref:CaiB/BaiF CoA transferase family protein n=1 Tax=Croceicoccus sp. Ery15 TaxID=1703338 RepID=UPI0021084EED|nr:CaiB/BaiF CoA-transferase family protein [Croceicoccus sp. Ery15]
MPHGPLAGIRIVEMDAIGPVPLCGMILSGLGAEVVRVTRPGGHSAWGDIGDAVVLRGRTEVQLDLKSDKGKQALLELADHADALIEGARPGVMERLGLGPPECLARNPSLVFARMTGWGQEGDLSKTAGHDINYIAMTGALHAIGKKGEPPTVPLNLVGDYAGGTMFMALGIVSAVLSARQTGRGQVVDAAMVDGVANLLGLYHAFVANGLWQDEPESNLLDGGAPFYQCYLCHCGGSVAVGALEPQFFAALLDGLNVPQDRYDQNDRSQWPAMQAEFKRIFASASRDDWEQRFAGTDACVSPVLSLSEATRHPVNAERSVFIDHNGVMQAAPAPRFSATPGQVTPSRSATVEDIVDAWTTAG